MASSGISENKVLGGVLSLAGSKLHWCVIFYNHSAWRVIFVLDFRDWWILHLKLEAQTLIKNRNSWLHFPVLFLVLGGARMAQWWEHSPPNNVARVQIPAPTPYVSVEFVVGSLACSERFFSGYSGFPLSQSKTNIFKFHFDQESDRQRSHFVDVLPLNHYIFLFIIIFICSSTSDLDSISTALWVIPDKRLFEEGTWAHFPNSGW